MCIYLDCVFLHEHVGSTPEEKARNLWEGVAHTGKEKRHQLQVYAKFKHNKTDFFPLLEYKLVADE